MIGILVVAAGKGTRAGGGLPKQYRPIAGRPLLAWTLSALRQALPDAAIKVVIGAGNETLYASATADFALDPPVIGGAERQDSVRLGLEAFADQAPDTVLIHDAARPFPSPVLIQQSIDLLHTSGVSGTAPALALSDTIKRCDSEGAILETVPREGLWRVQTPQTFRYRDILSAHRAAAGSALLTDDLGVAERAGLKVSVFPGDEGNLKVTSADDVRRAEAQILAAAADIRVGQGFDVHAFCPGDHVMLGGIKVPHEFGLDGHSDADVALHALTDAVLGAIGAGDIGQHFPPTDPAWRGASSDRFLAHAASLVRERQGFIAHVDLTIICERPKVGQHRAAMAERIADILGLAPDRVSIKATTTEKLGFTGRREGLAAMATATVRLPL